MTIGLQCNFCGNFETITGCVYCSAPVCARCSLNHQPICEELSKKRKAKAGATVRRVGEVPARELFTANINQPLQITQVFPPDTPQEFLESLNADAEAHNEALLTTLARAIEVPEVDEAREQKAIESFLEEVDPERGV